MTQNSNDLTAMSDRATRLIDALSGSIMSACEAAAEKIELAAEVARVTTRMAAVSTVLEVIGAQKMALASRLTSASGAMAALLGHQIEALSLQEVAVLKRIGVSAEVATQAVIQVDGIETPDQCGVKPRNRRQLTNGAAN